MLIMLKPDQIRKLFKKYKIENWTVRIEKKNNLSILAWNNELRKLEESKTDGFSVLLLDKNSFGFASSNDFEKIEKTIKKAIEITKIAPPCSQSEWFKKYQTQEQNFKINKFVRCWRIKRNFKKLSLKEKRDLVLSLAQQAYKFDKKIKSAIINYSITDEEKIFLNKDSFLEQNLSYARLFASITAFSKEKSEEQFCKLVGRKSDNEIFKNFPKKLNNLCKETLMFLNADKPEPGNFTVLMDGILTGIFIHEALGHATEADIVLSGGSCLTDFINKKIAPDFVSVIDDPTSNNFLDFGSYFFDDEGIKTQKTYLIKNGVLKTFLHSKETSCKLKSKPTGNSRAESYYAKPIIRMSNTFIEKGKNTFKQMLSKIEKGYLLKSSRGGQVNTVKGSFQFGVKQAYFVEKGKIIKPIRNISIGGNTLEMLKNILMIENKYGENNSGFCGKEGQDAAVGGRNPSVLVKNVLIC